MPNSNKLKKFALSFVLSVFTLLTLFGAIFFAPAPAQAQWGVSTLLDFPRMMENLGATIKESFKQVVMTSAIKGISTFMRKIAYDSAVWLASGGKGQSPFAHTKGFGDYMGQVAGDAAAEAIDTMGKTWGLDLCKIPNIQLDLALRLGMRQRYNGDITKEARCSFQEMQAGWSSETFNSMYGSDQIGNRFNATLSADMDSDLGIYLKSNSKLDQLVSTKEESAKLERQEGKGFLPLAGMINGDVKTPAAVMEEGFKQSTPDKAQKKSEDEINAVLASGAYQVLPVTLSTFLNTLTSQMLKNFMENGMLPFGACIGGLGDSSCDSSVANYEGSGSTVSGRDAAQAAFSEFLVAKPTVLDKYDLVPQLGTCPDAPGIYNCRIDSDFAEVIKTENFDRPITIEEALATTKLHGDWKLIPPTNALDSDKNCFEKNAYCYSNIRVLRQTRILPLGFEIAAKNSDPDHPWSLGDVVKGFYDCNYQKDSAGNIVGVNYDPINKPYCHLIDPRWVLKSPPARCNALTSGASLMMAEAPTRLDECVDLSTCVAYNNDGSCLSYGYCAREKNTWRFEADKCDSYNATCKAFSDANGNQVAYLYRTLDTGSCNQNTAGCRAFSLEQDDKGWIEPKINGMSDQSSPSNYNSGVHLNNKVSSPCSAPGCTAFNVEAPTGNEQRYLQKAPDYLRCYDADPTTKKIEVPQNNADLAKIKPRPECSQYAGVCIPNEIGCNWFTSILTGESIPGKFKSAVVANSQVTWNDQCDARCDGYAAYKEIQSNYSNGQEIAYVIPPNSTNNAGTTCQPEEESCTSFTNMGESFAGGEKIEHYTYLRPCIKPDAEKQKNYYTYEGADGAIGYQLKSYTLEKDTDGGPKYWARTAVELAQYVAECTEDRYKKGLTSADCRQFNDDQGKVYYRLLRQVVVVNNNCTNYRLNSSEFASANPANNTFTCFQNGEYRDGFCYYFGLPNGIATTAGQSNGCAKEVESCRAYKGNAANRVKNVFDTLTFEDATKATEGWSVTAGNMAVSAESTQTKGHSLNHSGAGNLEKTFDVKLGKGYVVSFWAKGNQQGVGVKIKTDQVNNVGTINMSDVWQYYTLTSKDISGGTTSGTLQFIAGTNLAGGATPQLYVDNVNLKEITDYIYLVKKSLKIDQICDSEPNDNLPGEALGCTGYNDSNKNPFYLTNFSYLCREGAIGCAKMFDTYNTPDHAKAMMYNVQLTKSSGASGEKLSVKIGSDTFACQVPVGEKACYVNVKGYTDSEITAVSGQQSNVLVQSTTSTVYIPPDSTSTDPMYLVINQDSVCTVADQGCTIAGLMTQTPMGTKFVTTTIKNDPTTYDQTICSNEAVGCNSYSVGPGSYYFKDPAVTGQKVCAYNNKATVNGQVASGWFWKGVGQCAATSTLNTSNTLGGSDCTKTEDCSVVGQTCQNIDNIPCYPSYIQTGNDYGLWSYGDKAKYENFVGQCPAEQSGCTEYVDKNDKKNEQDKGRPYFFLDNDKISAGDCSGLASLKYGCVLFDQVDKPGKLWNTASTYQKSDGADGIKVEPIKNTNALLNDANTIIKVNADRECGEWLACRDTQRTWDDKRGVYKNICTSIGRCNSKPETIAQENIYNCGNFMTEQDNLYANKVLTEGLYIARKVTWDTQEFSGYSILNSYPVEELSQVDISSSSADWRLVKTIACGGKSNCAIGAPSSSPSCKTEAGAEGSDCGLGNIGICKNGTCIQNISGTKNLDSIANNTNKLGSNKPICRAYPSKDAPFPNIDTIANSIIFGRANTCNEVRGPLASGKLDSLAYACDCSYTEAVFGDQGIEKRYFSYYNPNSSDGKSLGSAVKFNPLAPGVAVATGTSDYKAIPPGICQGGEKAGEGCNKDADCGNTSACLLKTKENKFLGWKGYCLESDASRFLNADNNLNQCMTWFPVDSLSGVEDVNNQNKNAGFEPGLNLHYCLETDLYKKPSVYRWCHDIESNDWTNTEEQCRNPLFHDNDMNFKYFLTKEEYDRLWVGFVSDKLDEHKASIHIIPETSKSITGGGKYAWMPTGNQYYADSVCPPDYVPFIGTGNEFDGGPDCENGYSPDECGYECTPTQKIIDDSPYIAQLALPGTDPRIGCSVAISIDDKAVGWTERLWDNGKYEINTVNVDNEYQDKLNYVVSTQEKPFAGIQNPFTSLIDVTSCNGTDKVMAPFSDINSICGTYATGYAQPTPSRYTYDSTWNFTNAQSCSDSTDCNKGVVCQSSEKFFKIPGLDTTNYYQQYCRKDCNVDADCLVNSDNNFNGKCHRDSYCVVKNVYYYNEFGLCANNSGTVVDASCKAKGKTDKNGVSEYNCRAVCSDNTNKSCEKDENCYVQSCQGNRCINDADIATADEKTKQTNIDYASLSDSLSRLGQIFAKFDPLNIMVFDGKKYVYKSVVANTQVDSAIFDRTETGDDNNILGYVPKVHPLGECTGDNKCIELKKAGITINNKTDENAKIFIHPALAIMKFFAYADPNHMPLTNVTINWDDGTVNDRGGFYRNHIGASGGKCINGTCTVLNDKCSTDSDCKFVSPCVSDSTYYRLVKNLTCDDTYFQYSHVYQCTEGGPSWQEGNNCPDPTMSKAPYGGCCVFKPKVQVKDNWGWYNGSGCGDANSIGGEGCYSNSSDTETTFDGAYTYFSNNVLVAPR